MTAGEVEPFPWSSVEQFGRGQLAVWRDILSRVRGGLDGEKLSAALSQRLGETVTVRLDAWRSGEFSGVLQTGDDPVFSCLHWPLLGLCMVVVPESDLALLCVARLLGQKFELGLPNSAMDPALLGAVGALALDLARQCSGLEVPKLRVQFEVVCRGMVRTATIAVGARSYCLQLWAALLPGERAVLPLGPQVAHSIELLGAVEVRIPWVVAVCWVPAAELQLLAPMDVWLSGSAWFSAERGFAEQPPLVPEDLDQISGCLAAPGAAWGWPVSGARQQLTLGTVAQLIPAKFGEGVESVMSERRPQLQEVLGEAAVVVRVELGAVEMSASQWAQLRPGDIVQTGRRVGKGVQLRAGGQLIAEGQLVQVDGEIGVRILAVAGEQDAGSVGTTSPTNDE